jgi:hypothetical protein
MPIFPNDLDIPPLQFRRAISSTVTNYVAAEGEPVWATDTKKLYIGDGSTTGGIEISGGGGSISTVTDQSLFTTSSVTFANVNITNTATVDKLKIVSPANLTATNILYYDNSTGLVSFSAAAGFVGGNPFNQTLNTTNNVQFNSVVTEDVVSAGGFPLDANGRALIVASNTQSGALVVSNYTSGLIPEMNIRGWGQNRPGTVTTATSGTPALYMQGARGTPASPLPTGNGDALFALGGGGYDGARWSSEHLHGPQIIALATENFAGNATTATNAGSRIFFRSQPQGVQLNSTSRQAWFNQTWTAGSASAPPTNFLGFGTAFNDTPTLINANGVDTHVGYGATTLHFINTKPTIYGVPFEDAAVFTGSISGTTLDVTAVSSGIISTGQRVYGTGITSGTFITALVTGAGGTGTYTISPSQTVASMTMNSGADNTTLNDSAFLQFSTGRKSGASGRRNSVKAGDIIGKINFAGQTSNLSTGAGSRGATIRAQTLENYSGSVRGTKLFFATVNTGTNNEVTRLELKDRENIYNSDKHTFTNAAGNLYVNVESGQTVFTNDLIQFKNFANDRSRAIFSTSTAEISSDNIVLKSADNASQFGAFTSNEIFLRINDSNIVLLNDTSGVTLSPGNTSVAIFNTQTITLIGSSAIGIQSTQILAGDGVDAPRIQGQVGMYLSSGNGGVGSEIVLQPQGSTVIVSSGTNVATFSTATTQLKTDEFTVNMVDNTQLLTAAVYGVRVNQGTLYVGDPGDDGTIRTSSSGDDLTIQSNNGSTGGKILLQETNGVLLYANGTEVTNISTSTAQFNVPVKFPVYTAAAKPASGSVGQQIAISDSGGGGNPNGMMAFWDTTHSRWSYIHDNSAV